MPRYFSIPLPNNPQIMQVQNYLRRVLPEGTTYQDPATFHITLVYIEDEKDAQLAEIVMPDVPRFGVGGGVVEYFPAQDGIEPVVMSLDTPRVLHILHDALYYAIAGMGAKISAYSYPQAWRPHITLAYAPARRVEPESDEDYLSRAIWSAGAQAVHLEIDRVDLAGDDYRVVRTWMLRETIAAQEMGRASETVITGEMTPIAFREASVMEGGRQRIRQTCVVEMRGSYPEIPLPADVQREDGDVFVTLPVGAFNSRSRNERTYSEAAMRSMLAQINARRPEGMGGHVLDESARYDFPVIRWLAAVERNGVIYAKGRVQTEAAKQYFVNAKRDNARVGTSLYAWAEMDGEVVTDLDLITIDVAPPDMVGVPMTAARPMVTAETTPAIPARDAVAEQVAAGVDPQGGAPIEESDESDESDESKTNFIEEQMSMGDKTLETVQAELKTAHESVSALTAEKATLGEQVSALGAQLAALTEALGVETADAALTSVQEMVLQRERMISDSIKAQVAEGVKLEPLRPLVTKLVIDEKPRTSEAIAAALAKVLDSDVVKPLIPSALAAEMGPAHKRGTDKTEDDAPDAHDARKGSAYIVYPKQ